MPHAASAPPANPLTSSLPPLPCRSDHWRRNTPVLGARHRAFAIDLLGYGQSDKPDPRSAPPNSLYSFDTWGRQLADFIDQVVQSPAVISTNSVGGRAPPGPLEPPDAPGMAHTDTHAPSPVAQDAAMAAAVA